MCYKAKILNLLSTGEKPLLEVIKGTIGKDPGVPRYDRAVNTLLTDIAALIAARMITREFLAEDELIGITSKGLDYLKEIKI